MNPKGMAILKALDQASEKYNATPGAIALAWLMNQPTIAAPIASVTTMEQFNEIAKAVEIGLDDETLAELNEASRAINNQQ
jgi:aryl-alcohol dehydrogenase-like predicted oxidoreductase